MVDATPRKGQKRASAEGVRPVRPGLRVAQEMGARLGAGALLLREVPTRRAVRPSGVAPWQVLIGKRNRPTLPVPSVRFELTLHGF